MFTIDADNEIKSGDIIDGRLFQYVAISTFRQLFAAVWALLLILTLQYGINLACWLTGFSVFERISSLPTDIKYIDNFNIADWLVLALTPFCHVSRVHFTFEMICIVFLILHASNVLGQFTTLILTLVAPYFSLFILFVLGAPILAIGTLSASAALFTVSMIAHNQQLFFVGRPQQVILVCLGITYLFITPFGTIVAAMSGISIGILFSYISKINLSRSKRRISGPLLAITYYYVPLRFALLAIPMTLILLLGAFFFGKN